MQCRRISSPYLIFARLRFVPILRLTTDTLLTYAFMYISLVSGLPLRSIVDRRTLKTAYFASAIRKSQGIGLIQRRLNGKEERR